MKIAGMVFIVPAVFLIADAILALVFGQRYMLWGLEFTLDWYQNIVRRITGLPRGAVLAVKLVECAGGLAVLIWGLRLCWG
ncbi:MAG: hypothetical protein M0Q91_16220 [Methanoregula sp.]|jgi:uncharacterized membrane protein|nr:hypothetical protein [Methanoregula sp.]